MGEIMGLIRKAIFIGGLILAIPSPPPDGQDQTQAVAQSSIGAGLAYASAVSDAVGDAKGFCSRQPKVCSTAQYFAGSLQGKARYSVKLITQWASETGAAPASSPAQLVADAPTKPNLPAAPALRKKTHVNVADNSDLKIEDLINDIHGTLPPAKDPKKG